MCQRQYPLQVMSLYNVSSAAVASLFLVLQLHRFLSPIETASSDRCQWLTWTTLL